ncbi:hypothetical protein GGS20DRAFT_241113 [Poronia punctata]|nr:hypothetical protein GGS20DRAFT_241113 [Poronia punctata]
MGIVDEDHYKRSLEYAWYKQKRPEYLPYYAKDNKGHPCVAAGEIHCRAILNDKGDQCLETFRCNRVLKYHLRLCHGAEAVAMHGVEWFGPEENHITKQFYQDVYETNHTLPRGSTSANGGTSSGNDDTDEFYKVFHELMALLDYAASPTYPHREQTK